MKTIVKNNTAINQEIERIFDILSDQAHDGAVVIREKARNGSSSVGMISILNRDDVHRQETNRGF